MADKPVFLYMGQYDDPALAKADLETVRKLHRDRVIGTYDAAVVVKKPDGKVHIDKWEKPTQHGAWTGAAVGAVVGIIFPPAIIGSAVVGGVAGGLIGHFWRGMSRKDMHELGEFLDQGDAAVVVMSRHKLTDVLADATVHAKDRVEKELKAHQKDVEDELQKASDAQES